MHRARSLGVGRTGGSLDRPLVRFGDRSVLDSFSLAGKVAIVTGASSGLGVSFATGLADAGADVTICARRVEKLAETKRQVEALGRRCLSVRADVSEPADCKRVVELTVAQLGKVDVLINNAGIGAAVPASRSEHGHAGFGDLLILLDGAAADADRADDLSIADERDPAGEHDDPPTRGITEPV